MNIEKHADAVTNNEEIDKAFIRYVQWIIIALSHRYKNSLSE